MMMCCHKYHWCATMIDVELKDISIYDPTSSSYIVGVRAIAEKLATQLPDYAPRRSWRPSRQLQLRYDVLCNLNCLLVRKVLAYSVERSCRYLCMCIYL
ncbi:hypothetical protein GQ600_13346 [Phytophthora cactorum]|nr:hypothetical protein GQ600_13346 [Phytophthora cactorum]